MNIETCTLISSLESDDCVVNHICPWQQIVLLTQLAGQEEYGIQSTKQGEREHGIRSGKCEQSPVLVTDSHHPLHPQQGSLLPLASNFNPIVQVLPVSDSVLMVGCGTLQQCIGTHHTHGIQHTQGRGR